MQTPERWILAFSVSVFTGLAAAAGLSEADRRQALAELERTRAGVAAATQGLSDAQWKFKPAPDRWSVAEILEHLVLAEDFLLENTRQKVMQAPAGKPDRDYKSTDRMVLSAVADRSRKVQAPASIQPRGGRPPQEAWNRFLQAREQTVAFLKSTQDLRDHVVDSPLGRPMDAYQWILYISAHTERHTKQMLEVKADPNFPGE